VEETSCLVTHCCGCTGISLIVFCCEHKKQKSLYKGNGFGIFIWLVCKESGYHFLVMSVTLKLSYIWETKAETL